MRRDVVKSVIGAILTGAMIMTMSFTAFANDAEVKASADNINITKTATWTTVDGKKTDSNSNPYALINFKIDTTNATTEITNVVSKGGSADVVLLIDNTASYETKFPLAKKAAGIFVDNIMSLTTNQVRVGVIDFGSTSYIRSELSSDKAAVKKAVDNLEIDPVRWGTHMHLGAYNAQKMLESSTADTKVIVLLSDGEPNKIIGQEELDYEGSEKATGEQLKEAATKIPGLKIVTIGYCRNQKALDVLKSYATTDATGKKLFYTASDSETDISNEIINVFEKISVNVTSYVTGNTLVDLIPKEMYVIPGTLTSNDSNVTPSISADNKTVSFSWGSNKLEKKVYEMSLIAAVDTSKLSANQKAGAEKIFTNGETVDVKVDSLGSSYFSYAEGSVIKLTSPKLSLADTEVAAPGEKVQGAPEGEDDGQKTDDTPQTSDAFNIVIVLGIIVSGTACFVIKIRERRRYI